MREASVQYVKKEKTDLVELKILKAGKDAKKFLNQILKTNQLKTTTPVIGMKPDALGLHTRNMYIEVRCEGDIYCENLDDSYTVVQPSFLTSFCMKGLEGLLDSKKMHIFPIERFTGGSTPTRKANTLGQH